MVVVFIVGPNPSFVLDLGPIWTISYASYTILGMIVPKPDVWYHITLVYVTARCTILNHVAQMFAKFHLAVSSYTNLHNIATFNIQMMRVWEDQSVFCRTGPPDSWTGPRYMKDLGPVRFFIYALKIKLYDSCSCPNSWQTADITLVRLCRTKIYIIF